MDSQGSERSPDALTHQSANSPDATTSQPIESATADDAKVTVASPIPAVQSQRFPMPVAARQSINPPMSVHSQWQQQQQSQRSLPEQLNFQFTLTPPVPAYPQFPPATPLYSPFWHPSGAFHQLPGRFYGDLGGTTGFPNFVGSPSRTHPEPMFSYAPLPPGPFCHQFGGQGNFWNGEGMAAGQNFQQQLHRPSGTSPAAPVLRAMLQQHSSPARLNPGSSNSATTKARGGVALKSNYGIERCGRTKTVKQMVEERNLQRISDDDSDSQSPTGFALLNNTPTLYRLSQQQQQPFDHNRSTQAAATTADPSSVFPHAHEPETGEAAAVDSSNPYGGELSWLFDDTNTAVEALGKFDGNSAQMYLSPDGTADFNPNASPFHQFFFPHEGFGSGSASTSTEFVGASAADADASFDSSSSDSVFHSSNPSLTSSGGPARLKIEDTSDCGPLNVDGDSDDTTPNSSQRDGTVRDGLQYATSSSSAEASQFAFSDVEQSVSTTSSFNLVCNSPMPSSQTLNAAAMATAAATGPPASPKSPKYTFATPSVSPLPMLPDNWVAKLYPHLRRSGADSQFSSSDAVASSSSSSAAAAVAVAAPTGKGRPGRAVAVKATTTAVVPKPDRPKCPRPRMFALSQLAVGRFFAEAPAEPGAVWKLYRVKLIFSSQKMVYEFESKHVNGLPGSEQLKMPMARIDVPWNTVHSITHQGDEYIVMVRVDPIMFLGHRQSRPLGMRGMICTKYVDVPVKDALVGMGEIRMHKIVLRKGEGVKFREALTRTPMLVFSGISGVQMVVPMKAPDWPAAVSVEPPQKGQSSQDVEQRVTRRRFNELKRKPTSDLEEDDPVRKRGPVAGPSM
ncbi:hypothetical protein BV898_08097 [Hypsibius exemplaris]|uniref:Uncharacterized protein n=1 Tax=Hypsibius exemplaris TaxID=2072580 RepID=A0A1W0WRG5_HYPEX|nr:hypothetical protein BV898_08097 [Hypsibius exemplaris]